MSRLGKIIFVLAIFGGFAWLQFLIEDNLQTGWPHNVVRNWKQFGFTNLHGQLVINPGGFQVFTKPKVYNGMSPVSLYPAFFIEEIFAWTHLGSLPFLILIAAAVFWAIWILLGRDDVAFMVASVAILCPGYGRWLNGLDPNVTCVLLGLPYIAIVLSVLKRPRLGAAGGGLLLVLTLAFLSLNWTTLWVIGPFALLLLGLPQVSRRAAILFVGSVGAGSFLFALISAMAKSKYGHAGGGGGMLFLKGYTWGSGGYGTGLTTETALVRLGFVNGVALLPMLLLVVWMIKKCFDRTNPKSWFALLPAILMLMEVIAMRNYFGHHPWMAAPVLLVGMVFSLVLLRENRGEMPVSTCEIRAFAIPSTILLCIMYGLVVLMFFRANGVKNRSLIALVRAHTQRSEYIAVVKRNDPQTAQLADQLDDPLDRHTLTVDLLGDLASNRDDEVILSSVPIAGLHLRAQSSAFKEGAHSFLEKTGDWFNRSIAKRRPGDRIDFANTYFLYDKP